MIVETVKYLSGQQAFESQLVYAEGAATDRPLLLISSNWLGMSEGALDRAKTLVADKYVGLLVDMYGDGKCVTGGPEEAGPLADGLRNDWQERRARISAAYKALIDAVVSRKIGDLSRKAAIGFCFGGGNVLELARDGADLQAVVCIHGDLTTPKPAQAGEFQPPVLILHGAADPIEPQQNRLDIEAELSGAGVNWQLHIFGGLVHSYSEAEADIPDIAHYDEVGARQSLRLAQAFIESAFVGEL